MINFILGVLFVIVFSCLLDGIAKDHKWDRWTVDDFKLAQESELKEFLLHKSDQAKVEEEAEEELRAEIRKEVEEELRAKIRKEVEEELKKKEKED